MPAVIRGSLCMKACFHHRIYKIKGKCDILRLYCNSDLHLTIQTFILQFREKKNKSELWDANLHSWCTVYSKLAIVRKKSEFWDSQFPYFFISWWKQASTIMCCWLNKELDLTPRPAWSKTVHVCCIYSGYGKYSDPLKFFTLCYIAAIC